MRHSIDLSDDEYNSLIEQFYKYFADGYKFEEFLKTYLEKIGLDEVVVTQRSRDGGRDLTAIRTGIGDLGGQDFRRYYVQAKRYKPSTSIRVKDVRELYCVAGRAQAVGIFITTAKFSENTRNEFKDDQVTPIILIDGKDLVSSCIDNELGFIYKPIFNAQAMDKLMPLKKEVSNDIPDDNTKIPVSDAIIVEKRITANDIRARILSLPKIILDNIPAKKTSISVCFNNETNQELSINKGRNYLARVTEIYRNYGLLSDDGTITPATAIWQLKDGKLSIFIKV